MHRLLMLVPAYRRVYAGMCDSADGLLPRANDWYYEGGYSAGIRYRADA